MRQLIYLLIAALPVTSKAARFPGAGKPDPDVPSSPGNQNTPHSPLRGPNDTPGSPFNPSTDPIFPGPDWVPSGGYKPGKWPADLADAIGNMASPSQDEIEFQMGSIEANLESVQNVTAVNVTIVEVVSAILTDANCGREESNNPLRGDPTSTPCPTPAFKPTSTVPTTSFGACQTFALILSSCYSATPLFYSLAPTAQASCVCYSMPKPSSQCGSGDTITQTVTASYAPSRFDGQVKSCHDYFDIQGYNGLANKLEESEQIAKTLGVGFCGEMSKEIINQGNRTTGLPTAVTTTVKMPCTSSYSNGEVKSTANSLSFQTRTLFASVMISLFAVTISSIIFA